MTIMRSSILITMASMLITLPVFGVVPEASKKPARSGALKTTITGKRMEMRSKGNVVIFSDDAQVTRGDTQLKAQTITQDKKADMVTAEGNVVFKAKTEKGEPLNAQAQNMQYYMEKQSGALWGGRPIVSYHMTGSTQPAVLTADRVEFDRQVQEVRAYGDVSVVTSSVTALGAFARLDEQNHMIWLDGEQGQPKLIADDKGKTHTFVADHITVWMDRRRIQLEGRVYGTIQKPE